MSRDVASTDQPAVPVWTCAFEKLEGSVEIKDLTVGAKFSMRCHGDIAAGPWDIKQLPKISFKEDKDNYSLVVLQNDQLDPQDARLVVTSYTAGKHQPEFLRVMQGDKGFEVAKPEWEVKSVLEPGKQQKPYGPFGPFSVSLPLWIWIALACTIGLILFAIVRRLRRVAARKRMLEEIKRHRTTLSPLHQFYRDSRTLRRRIHGAKVEEELKLITSDLNREFRLYLLRQFEIPTLEWTDTAILKDLRKRHRHIFVRAADPLKKTLRELLRTQAQARVSLQDVEQLHRMSLDTAERIERAREEEGRR